MSARAGSPAPVPRRRAARESGLNRWVPWLAIGAAALHFVVAFTLADWSGIAGDGFVNAVGDEAVPDNAERMATLWFFMAGIGFLAFGTFARWAVEATGRMPGQIGGYLLLAGVPMAIMQPVSGGVLLTVIGILALIAARHSPSPREQ
ncbi:DUF6463 family protein [Nonomuraea africana]|uniref:Uncharacterized protein n=1 Tax=Nonomuraea africana TaxID=46171 RepID=A0ABR9KB49_9ACTN|nr:DUF6463 family protein [Nonomuraea africana]MBE1559232.1 hypothetical protein [Nonomuraea africana]